MQYFRLYNLYICPLPGWHHRESNPFRSSSVTENNSFRDSLSHFGRSAEEGIVRTTDNEKTIELVVPRQHLTRYAANKEFNMFRIMQTSVVLGITAHHGQRISSWQARHGGNGPPEPQDPLPPRPIRTFAPVNTRPYFDLWCTDEGSRALTPAQAMIPGGPNNTQGRDYCNWGHHCRFHHGCDYYLEPR